MNYLRVSKVFNKYLVVSIFFACTVSIFSLCCCSHYQVSTGVSYCVASRGCRHLEGYCHECLLEFLDGAQSSRAAGRGCFNFGCSDVSRKIHRFSLFECPECSGPSMYYGSDCSLSSDNALFLDHLEGIIFLSFIAFLYGGKLLKEPLFIKSLFKDIDLYCPQRKKHVQRSIFFEKIIKESWLFFALRFKVFRTKHMAHLLSKKIALFWHVIAKANPSSALKFISNLFFMLPQHVKNDLRSHKDLSDFDQIDKHRILRVDMLAQGWFESVESLLKCNGLFLLDIVNCPSLNDFEWLSMTFPPIIRSVCFTPCARVCESDIDSFKQDLARCQPALEYLRFSDGMHQSVYFLDSSVLLESGEALGLYIPQALLEKDCVYN